MRSIKTLAITSILVLSGCASNDGSDGIETITNAASSVGSSIGGAVTGVFHGYESGLKISESDMKKPKTRKEVIEMFGHPNEKEELRGVLLYKYPYVRMPVLGGTINEFTVFEFDKKDKVIQAYKTNKKSTGIAELDTAAGW
jgi:hypothetical protein